MRFVDLVDIDPTSTTARYTTRARTKPAALCSARQAWRTPASRHRSFRDAHARILAAIVPKDGRLICRTMCLADELNRPLEIPSSLTSRRSIAREGVAMAAQLIESRPIGFETGKFHDTYLQA